MAEITNDPVLQDLKKVRGASEAAQKAIGKSGSAQAERDLVEAVIDVAKGGRLDPRSIRGQVVAPISKK